MGQIPVSVSFCPPLIPQGLAWDRNRTTAVRSRRLTARDKARPNAAQSSRMLLYSYCV